MSPILSKSLTYRGFDVQDHGYGCWAYFRKEWDLGDPSGTATCFDDACQQIDEWWDEAEPVEIEQFDETVADDFNNDITGENSHA